MRFKRVLPAPGRSAWWWVGAMSFGLAVPTIIAGAVMAVGFHPVGSTLQRSVLWSEFGVTLLVSAFICVVLIATPIYALLAQSWRSLGLALALICSLAIGSVPAMMAGRHVRAWALDSFSQRSQPLIDAVTNYVRATGTPPASLAELSPQYLPTTPGTGIAAQPDYRYEPEHGPCSLQSTWHVSVWFPEFFSAYRLLYCPDQDYGYVDTVENSRWRMMFGAWMFDLVYP